MKKKAYAVLSAFMLVMAISFWACRKSPNDGVKLIVNVDFIQYHVFLDIRDAATSALITQNLTMAVTGRDANFVYNMNGKKDFTVKNGQIDIGLNPAYTPTTDHPAIFNVQLYAPGYIPLNKQITITADKKFRVVKIKAVNTTSPPAGLGVVQQEFALNNGVMTDAGKLKIGGGILSGTSVPGKIVQSTSPPTPGDPTLPLDTTYHDDANTTLVIPKGTTYYYYVDTVNQPYTTPTLLAVNSTDIATERVSNYYAKENLIPHSYIKKAYGGTYLRAVMTYGNAPVQNLGIQVINYANYSPAISTTPISLLNKTSELEGLTFYDTAVRQHLKDIIFIGRVNVNGQEVEVQLSPDKSSPWFASFRINKNYINPITNRAIMPGDSIETGVDVLNNRTTRSVVVQAKGNDYRVQCQSYDAGYYYRAPFRQEFNYTINTKLGLTGNSYEYVYVNNPNKSSSIPYDNIWQYQGVNDATNIPDVENVVSYLTMSVTGYGNLNLDYFYPNSGDQVYKGIVLSGNSAISISASTYVGYWDLISQSSPPITAATVKISPYAGLFNTLNPVVTVDGSIVCTGNSSSEFKPSYTLYANISGGVYISFKNGLWSTRGFKQGKIYSYTGSVNAGNTITETDTINATYIKKVEKISNCSTFSF